MTATARSRSPIRQRHPERLFDGIALVDPDGNVVQFLS
jgi:hypothetical protein